LVLHTTLLLFLLSIILPPNYNKKVKNKLFTVLLTLLGSFLNTNAQVYINEVMPSNNTTIADEYGEFDDWIELYNSSVLSIDLRGKFITDDSSNPTKWEIPNTNGAVTTIPPQSYILLWADQDITQGEHHLGFKLSAAGDGIFLYENDGVTLIDGFNFPGVPTDNSYGRQPDGSASFQQFAQPTPDASNNNAILTAAKPILSPNEGVYASNQTVTITSSTQGANIYYTTDGSIPTNASTLYTQPIAVNNTMSIRAIAISPGFANSPIETNSYIINFTSSYPIVHITAEPDGLWNPQTGIYVIGTNGVAGYCNDTANYNLDTEILAHTDIFYPDGSQIADNNCGLKVSGNCARRSPQKPLELKFRNDYSDSGSNEVNYKIFEQKDIDVFKRLYLRKGNATGNSSYAHQYPDPVANLVIEGQMDAETAGVKIVEVFINDEYWGLYDLREKFDHHRFKEEYKFVTDKDSIDIIRNPGATWPPHVWWAVESVSQGTSTDYDAFEADFLARDLSIDSNYDAIVDQMQLDEMMNWLISGVFMCNRDWIRNNVKVWKHGKNGKWRWSFADFDHTQRYSFVDYDNLSENVLKTWPDGLHTNANELYKKLFTNPRFKDEFIQRMATYMNTVFSPSRVAPITDSLKNVYKVHNQRAYDRWVNDDSNSHFYSIPYTNSEIDVIFQDIFNFYTQRPVHIKQHFQSRWGILGMFTLNINTTAATNGKVAANNVYKELPINYTGEYFTNVPFKIHAIPNAGYRFSHWQETGITDATIEINTNLDLTLTPIFVPAEELVINEIHYHPATTSNEEFIEIYNPDAQAKDLSNYEFSNGICFKFPAGTTIAPGEYIVIAADASVYAGNGYQVFEWEYTNLSNGGETVGLANQIGGVLDLVVYDDSSPWNNQADGAGYSLALIEENLDNSIASNWQIQNAIFISPGAKNDFCTNFTASITAFNINCFGDNSGSAIAFTNSGIGPFTYSWNNGATTSTISSLSPGNYSLTVNDSFGCSYQTSATITQPSSALSTSEVHTNETVAGSNDGVINLAVSGGTGPYTYNWSNGATSQDISGLADGTYTVTVTDALTCTETISVTIQPGVAACNLPSNIVASNIQNTSATLSWDANPNANTFDVEYRIQGMNSWNAFSSNYSFAILNNLVACTTYEVRIKANCPAAQVSGYSSIYTFQSNGCVTACSTVFGLFSQNVTTSSAFLVWDIVPNATYTMYYRAVGNASWFSYPTQFPIAILFTLPSCTDFEWYVEVNCPTGQTSTPSPIANFTTVGAACKTQNNISTSTENETNIEIYPNPVNDYLNISFNSLKEQNVTFNIYNTTGQLIFTSNHLAKQNVNQFGFETNHFTKGNYVLEILLAENRLVKRFIKQ